MWGDYTLICLTHIEWPSIFPRRHFSLLAGCWKWPRYISNIINPLCLRADQWHLLRNATINIINFPHFIKMFWRGPLYYNPPPTYVRHFLIWAMKLFKNKVHSLWLRQTCNWDQGENEYMWKQNFKMISLGKQTDHHFCFHNTWPLLWSIKMANIRSKLRVWLWQQSKKALVTK